MAHRAISYSPADVARKSLRGAVALGIRQVITQGANAAGSILLARVLSPTQFGLVAVLTFGISFLTSFGGTGFAASLIREPAEPVEDDYRALFTVQELVVLVIAAAVVVIAPNIARTYHLPPENAWLFRLAALAFALTSLMVVPQVRLERHLDFGRLAVVEVAQALVYNAVAVLLALRGWGALSLAVALVVRSAMGAAMINLVNPWRPALRWDWARVRTHLSFGLPYQGIAAVSLMKDSVTPVFIGLLLGTQSVGYISWASFVSTYPVLALFALQRMYLPVFARLQTAPGLARYVEQTIWATNALVAPLAVLTLAFITPITHLVFGDQWLGALPLFYILWVANLSIATATPVLGLLNALGRSRTTFAFAAICAATMWAAGVPLSWRFGAVGIAWADLAVQVPTLLFFRAAQARVPFRILPVVVPPWIWAAIVGLLLFGAQHFRPITRLTDLVVYFACGLTVYGAGLAGAYRRELGRAWLSWKRSIWSPAF
ncbi:MAG TPA: oligosaccharide flippase family protein [bacterium]|nr:oligosaccharide flippase family protein [bacterium]